jgi:cytochrome c
MDVLNNIALPQSTGHFHLLLFIFNLAGAVLLPYLALLLGSMVMALVAERQARAGKGTHGLRLAKDLVDTVLPSKGVFTFLAILPALSMVFVYAQVLQTTPAIATGLAALGVLFLVAAGVALFGYRYTFELEGLLHSLAPALEQRPERQEVTRFEHSTLISHERAGRYGVIFLFLSAFLLMGAMAITVDPAQWRTVGSLLDVVVSGTVWLQFFIIAGASAGMCGAGMLFFLLDPDRPMADPQSEYGLMIRTVAVRMLTVALLVLPLLVVLQVATLPSVALSGWVYALAGIAIVLLMVSLQFTYAAVTRYRALYPAVAFAMLVLALDALVTKDQVAIHTATRDHAVVLANVFDKAESDLKASLGIGAPSMSGEDIFNAKCSACHLFDQKKVGPPYQQVLPKYAGKKPSLVAFILNPVKVDPAYPNMPSQGLKPAEADSIATYLLKKVGVKGS